MQLDRALGTFRVHVRGRVRELLQLGDAVLSLVVFHVCSAGA